MKFCKTCKWFEDGEFKASEKDAGFCHLDPPKTTMHGDGQIDRTLNVVLATDWCSHHKARR